MDVIAAPSPNFDARKSPPDMIVLHYTGMRTGEEALARLRDPEAKVSAHYLVEEDGRVFSLVAEERRAWHAGVSFWRGERDINAVSIGIEIVNPGHEFGYRDFPEAQVQAVIGTQTRRPFRKSFDQGAAHALAGDHFHPVALAIVEAHGFHPGVPLQRPGQAHAGVLAAGK